ncbi:MAG: membrane protein insertase YidC [Pseudomonadota bacterium]
MDRNTLLFIVLTAAVLIGWDAMVIAPQREALKESQRIEQEAAEAAQPNLTGDLAASPEKAVTIEEAIAKAQGRVPIDTPSLLGSINLSGARIDDLLLKNYHETIDDKSPMIRLLSPREAEHGHYIEQGFVASDGTGSKLTESLVWTAPENAKLTPSTPVTLTARLGSLVFENTYSVDDKFMFTVKQTVRNEGAAAERVTPYGLVVQRGIPTDAGKYQILHEGPLAVVGKQLIERKYKKALTRVDEAAGEQGWVGITNKYWLAAAAPPQNQPFKVTLKNVGTQTEPIFRANYTLDERQIAPGETQDLTAHLFGGAKDVDILRSYEQPVDKGGLGIKDLDKSVDWGNFFFLTRPIFWLLDFFGDHVGNFGVAILLLTLCVKALMFPLANKAFESMSAMKKVQPKLEELKARCGDDKAKLQQEMMELYKREKINPLAGCLPILIQMPIFYALYKTLFVTIELRHQPFILWIKDLSAPDPTSIFNLFGLLPFDPTSVPVIGAFLGIGVLPILYGIVMWLQTQMNPPAADPTQQQIMAMMPFIFVFLFAGFASGLVLYWLWSAALSILQQWYIMKRNGVEVNFAERIPFLKGKKPALEKK